MSNIRGRDLKPGDFSPEFPTLRVTDVVFIPWHGKAEVHLNGPYDDSGHRIYLKKW